MHGSASGRIFDGEIHDEEAIVDPRRLQADLAATTAADLPAEQMRARVLAVLKNAVTEGDDELRRRFDDGMSGTDLVCARCYLVDQIVRLAYEHVTEQLYPSGNPSEGERLALVAVGGYGRGELAPHSDVDLLFLLSYKMTPRSEQVTEAVLYLLWDIGFKVGQAVRSVDDCIRHAKADTTICTSLLERRFLCGDEALFQELSERFMKAVQAGTGVKFIEAKLAERDRRHARLGGSRYVLEPNIKDGKGGLRDLHTLYWIGKYLYRVAEVSELVPQGVLTRREVARFEKAENYLWTLRCQLHYLSGRAEERLTYDLQKRAAPRMGYKAHAGTQDVERLMKHYFLIAKDVGTLTRIFCAALEAEHKRRPRLSLAVLARRRRIAGFPLERDRLTVHDAKIFEDTPLDMLRIFKVAQDHDLDIHPKALHWITRNLKRIDHSLRRDPEANRVFMAILTSKKNPETALRRMNEAGVFGRFMPDFGRVVAQMQYNMYHHYTVDEHTIFAIGILHAIEKGRLREEAPIASEVVHKVLSRRVLYLAVLFHDMAKGRPGDHSQVGAALAQKVCPRLGLSAEETETVAWLVLHHLAMSNTAFRRDIDDSQTIADFAELVQSMERLRLLLVLTVADIRQARHRRQSDHRRLCRAGAVHGTPALAAGPDRGRHPGGRSEHLDELEGRSSARALLAHRGGLERRLGHRGPGEPCSARPGGARRGARRLAGGGAAGAPRARQSGLLAVLRCRNARTPRAHGPRGGDHRSDPGRRYPGRPLPGGHGDHGLHAGPAGPVLADRRGSGSNGGDHRRGEDLHPDQWSGARRFLRPRRHGRALRKARQIGAAVVGDRARHIRALAAASGAGVPRLFDPEPADRIRGAAARPDRQQGQRRLHGDRSQRP
jgi:[protein-PII] uridylyltransferase